VDAAHEVAQFGQRGRRGVPRLGHELPGGRGIGVHQPLDRTEGQPDRDEAGLRAVVQVTLDPADLDGLGVHGVGARPGEPLDPLGEQRGPGGSQQHGRPPAVPPHHARHQPAPDGRQRDAGRDGGDDVARHRAVPGGVRRTEQRQQP
jgi:hypothetical protein